VGRKTEISNLLAKLPRLGVGVGYRGRNREQILQNQPDIDFVEIVADDYLFATPEKRAELEHLTEHFTIIPQTLNLSLGSAEGVSEAYLKVVSELLHQLRPPWWSEHIGYTHAGGVELGRPAPLPFTREAVDVVARNMITVRRRIAAPLILESVDHAFDLPGAEMSETEFIREVLGWCGCGMQLDVDELYHHTVHRGRDPFEVVAKLPLDRVVQVHLHEEGQRNTTGGTESREIWKLLDAVLTHAPVRGIVIEQNDKFSSVEGLLDRVARARELGQRHRRWN
jgi:uncharacterized protein (UPF0276 family)